MKEKLGLSRRKSGLRFGTPPHHPSPSLADISLEKDGCGYFQDYQHLSALGNLIAPRGPIVRRASRCKKEKNTDNLFDYQCFLLEIGKRVPFGSGAGGSNSLYFLCY